jgi:MFS family permease
MLSAYRTIAGNRNLVRLFSGEFVSNIGDWLYLVALLVIVYRESSDPLLLGIVGGARIIPYIVLSVPAGFIIDRFDRRLILIVTDIIRGLAMVGMAANTFLDGPVLLTVGLAIFATCFAVFFRPTIGAYLPSLVRDESELGPANSVYATLGEVTFIIGPAIGGIIIAATDLGWAFVINAVSFLAPVVVLLGMPSNRPGLARAGAEPTATVPPAASDADAPTVSAGGTESDAAGEIAAAGDAGSRRAPATPATGPTIPAIASVRDIVRPVAGIAILDTVSGFLWGGLSVAIVILAVDRLGAGEDATGFLWAAVGVGGVIGAIGSSWIVLRPNLGPSMLFGAIVLSVGFVGLGLVTDLGPALVAMVVIAAGAILAEVVNTTILQRIVPDAIRGRTLGVMQTFSTLTYAAGSFLVPVLFTTLGAQVLLPIGGAAIFVAAIVTFILVGPAFKLTAATEAAAETLGRVAGLPLFAGVSPAALEVAVGRLMPIDVGAGTVVIREGDPADRFYIIESGRFAVDQRDPGTGLDRRLRVMGPDEVFGELGLMHNAPRSATVTAETDARLLALDGPDFLEILNAGPEVSGRMLERYRASAAPPS